MRLLLMGATMVLLTAALAHADEVVERSFTMRESGSASTHLWTLKCWLGDHTPPLCKLCIVDGPGKDVHWTTRGSGASRTRYRASELHLGARETSDKLHLFMWLTRSPAAMDIVDIEAVLISADGARIEFRRDSVADHTP